MTISTSRIVGTTAACAAIAATGFVMAAPANAAVTSLKIQDQVGPGSAEGVRGVGCTYEVTANVDAGTAVTFKVDGPGSADTESTVTPGSGVATYAFKPTIRGAYTINAVQDGEAFATPVKADVGGNGIQVDPETCLVLAP